MTQHKNKIERDYEALQAANAKAAKLKAFDAQWDNQVNDMAARIAGEMKAEAAAKEKAAKEQAEADFRQGVMDAFVQAGGKPELFPIEWPGLRAEIVRQRTLASFAKRPQISDVVTNTLAELYRGSPTPPAAPLSVITPTE